jgi:hypothetical protein
MLLDAISARSSVSCGLRACSRAPAPAVASVAVALLAGALALGLSRQGRSLSAVRRAFLWLASAAAGSPSSGLRAPAATVLLPAGGVGAGRGVVLVLQAFRIDALETAPPRRAERRLDGRAGAGARRSQQVLVTYALRVRSRPQAPCPSARMQVGVTAVNTAVGLAAAMVLPGPCALSPHPRLGPHPLRRRRSVARRPSSVRGFSLVARRPCRSWPVVDFLGRVL